MNGTQTQVGLEAEAKAPKARVGSRDYRIESVRRIPNDTFTKMAKLIDYVAGRWADESEYEDFQDYVTHIEKSLKAIDNRITDIETTASLKTLSVTFRFSDGSVHHYWDRLHLKVLGEAVVLGFDGIIGEIRHGIQATRRGA